MKLTPERLAQLKALDWPKSMCLFEDRFPDIPVRTIECARVEKVVREAVPALIADLEEATAARGNGVLVPAPRLEEMKAENTTLRQQLAEAQAGEARALADFDQLCESGPSLSANDFELIRMTVETRPSGSSALDAAIEAAVEPYRKQLAEAQALNARVIFVAEKMRCAGGSQEYQYWRDEMKFLSRKRATSALIADLEEATATRGNGVLVPSPKLEEMQAELATMRQQLAEAQALLVSGADLLGKVAMNAVDDFVCASGQKYADLMRQADSSALQSAIAEAVEPYRQQLAEAEKLPDRVIERVQEMQAAAYTFGDFSKEAVEIALDGVIDLIAELAATDAAIAAKGEKP